MRLIKYNNFTTIWNVKFFLNNVMIYREKNSGHLLLKPQNENLSQNSVAIIKKIAFE